MSGWVCRERVRQRIHRDTVHARGNAQARHRHCQGGGSGQEGGPYLKGRSNCAGCTSAQYQTVPPVHSARPSRVRPPQDLDSTL